MDKGILQRYSVWAKESLEQQVEVSLKTLGINSDTDIARAKRTGDVTTIEGDPNSYSADLYQKRNEIINLVKSKGYKNVIEEFSYTWFNRFVALRFMEVHDFLGHGFRVLSNHSGGVEPEILQNLGFVKDDLRLDMNTCSTLREQNKIEELFRYVLIQQCNALSGILPMLFSRNLGYLELLLPKNLLRGDTVITKMLDIPEEAFLEDVEIIGWMYQYYISSKKDAIFKSKETITKDTLPAVTQLFTPDWIVRYMAENSVGRIWLESYPTSSLRDKLKYYIGDVEQNEKVQKQIDEVKYENVDPEKIRIIEPCCGSGHILVYVFDLLYEMYAEKGYTAREIPTLILSKNIFGLDVDKRAVQLSSFALIMKARAANNRFFTDKYYVTPSIFEIIDSNHLIQMKYKKHIYELNLLDSEEQRQIDQLVDLFKNAKTIGSLLKIKNIDFEKINKSISRIEADSVSNIFNSEFLGDGIRELKHLTRLAKILFNRYDVLITNPPYVNSTKMDGPTKDYALKEYPSTKYDLFSMFIEQSFSLTKKNGFMSFMTPYVWMFIQSYESLRDVVINSKEIITLAQLEYSALEEAIVPLCTFTLRNNHIESKRRYYRLTDFRGGMSVQNKWFLKINETSDRRYMFETYTSKFKGIPGHPIAYWASDAILADYQFPPVSKYVDCKSGIMAGDDKYVMMWYEPSFTKVKLDCKSWEDMGDYKWFPLNSGGDFRKWSGNTIKVIDLWRDGANIRNNVKNYRLRDKTYYFQDGITWGRITSSDIAFRDVLPGTLFGDAGPIGFIKKNKLYTLGFLSSKVVKALLTITNPTLNFQVHDIMNLPLNVNKERVQDVEGIVSQNVEMSKADWDSFELSWAFEKHPLVRWSEELWDATAIAAAMQGFYGSLPEVSSSIELCYILWQGECSKRFYRLKQNEEDLNEIFIDLYGLKNELEAEVDDKDVTVHLAEKERDIKSLISYLVGVAMGRYSLNKEGLQFAGGQWDVLKYGEPLDDDGIIPIYSSLGMEDSLTTKIIKLVKEIFGKDDYKNNMDFIADALGKKSNESSEETLNRYLNEGFYNDHLKIYQKRPIYWMFSSGKNSGFKCLIYIHRYNADTLARINGKYFLPESTRIKNELDEINVSISTAEGRDRIRLEKERQKLAAKYNEAIEYGQVLDHMANKFIDIDLDDGVKVNYAKFQGIDLVTDNGTKVKKDLLVPIK